ncbi:hypothetical protein EMCRGX_G020421 [Ephydatia muelleri]
MALNKVEDVEIDADGVFKYILIEIKEIDKKSKQEVGRKKIVRGFSWAEYHSDIMDRVAPHFTELGLQYECVGGGRIKHSQSNKTLHVYGYSVSFGQAKHQLTLELLKKKYNYPEENFTCSNAGY